MPRQKDVLEQEGWLEALQALSPFAPLSARALAREPTSVVMAAELDSVATRCPALEQQLTLLTERLRVSNRKSKVGN